MELDLRAKGIGAGKLRGVGAQHLFLLLKHLLLADILQLVDVGFGDEFVAKLLCLGVGDVFTQQHGDGEVFLHI